MINPEIPLETRLQDNSQPTVAQSLANIIQTHEEDLAEDEVDALRRVIVLIAAVRQALDNRNGRRTRSLQVAQKGQIGFEANQSGGTINLLGSFKDGSSTSTAENQEVVIARVGGSCQVLIVDQTPLG